MMLYVIALIVLSSFLCFLHIQALFEFKENTQDFYFYFLFFFGQGGFLIIQFFQCLLLLYIVTIQVNNIVFKSNIHIYALACGLCNSRHCFFFFFGSVVIQGIVINGLG